MRDSSPSSTAHPPPSGQSIVPIASKQFKLSQTPPVDFSAAVDDHVVTDRALTEETSKPASVSKSPQVKNELPSPSRTINPPSSPQSPADPTLPFISGSAPLLVRSPPIDAHSSPRPKRASPDSPDSACSSPTSKRRKLIRGRVESMPPTALPEDADEVIPSSETDEEDMEINPARLPPRSIPSLAAISRLSGVYVREQPSPETPTPRDIESEKSQISAAETDSSEEQVSRQLEDDEDDAMDTATADDACDEQMYDDTDEVYMATPEEDELSSESARRSVPGPSTSRSRVVVPVIKEDPPTSDAESVDSEKALERAKNARLSSLEDDDDDLFDDDLMGPAQKKRPTPELRVPKGNPKPSTPVRKYKSPNALPADHIQRVRQAMESDSPLTSPSSPRKRETSRNSDSPSRPPSSSRPRYMTPSQGQVVVEIPPVPPHVDLSTYVRVSDKLPLPRPRRLPTPSAPGPSKALRVPKSAGGSALDTLLKEKEVWDKKYGDLLASAPAEGKKEGENSPVAGPSGSRAVSRSSLSPTDSIVGDLLLEPAKLKDILSVDRVRAKREEEAQKAAIIRERNTFWQPLDDNIMDVSSEQPLPFPAKVKCESPVLKLLKEAINDISVLHPDARLASATSNFLRQSLEEETGSFAEIELDVGTIRRHLTMLGMRDGFSVTLADEGDDSQPTPAFPNFQVKTSSHRNDGVHRLLDVISIFASKGQVHSSHIPKIVLALILLGQDPHTAAETSRAISQTIATTLQALDAVTKPSRINRLEREVSLTIIDALTGRSAAEALNFVAIIPRINARTTRIARWTALGMLKGSDAVKTAGQDEFMGAPNMKSLALMVQPESEAEELESKFNVDKAGTTDFKELRKNVGLLSIVLTDLSLYLETPTAAEDMEKLIRSIGYMSSGITDRSNEDNDRTEAKGEIQHLKIRITYQTSSKGKMDIYKLLTGGSKEPKVQSDLKSFFSSKP
ncbi:hypothetical protein FS837_007209 [Tulasnella sp. UAMH 9824]|nr:hypothetical protein FS837_007209 [Tulasnella sp. UAMH 9824]